MSTLSGRGSSIYGLKFPSPSRKSLFSRREASAEGWRGQWQPCFVVARSLASKCGGEPLKIGILRETYDKWERRAPLCPEHVSTFLARHPESKVFVQPSRNRVFSSPDYERAGAIIQEDLSDADLILGVKRPISTDELLPHKTYMLFSHVIKGQPENMSFLDSCLKKNVQLLDYECILEDIPPDSSPSKPKRAIVFGKFAGYAGMVDTFTPLGRRLLMRNQWSTPFLHCPPTIHHYNLIEMKQSVTKVAEHIAADGLPSDMPALVFAITGKGGCVYGGVREILNILPHETVGVKDLPEVCQQVGQQHRVYIVAPEKDEIYQRQDGTENFDRSDYMQNPHLYKSSFAQHVAPYSNVVVNTAYWDYRFPRLFTKDDIGRMYQDGNDSLLVVSDISCDTGGAIEFLDRSTTIDRPLYQYDPIQRREVGDHVGNQGVTMIGVDILPTELPADSSHYFGNQLISLMDVFVAIKGSSDSRALDMAKFPANLQQATVTTSRGTLHRPFQYLDSVLKSSSGPEHGSGASVSMTLRLEGHLFDSGLINHILDLVEQHECSFVFEECFIPSKSSEGCPVMSRASIRVTGQVNVDFVSLSKKIRDLVDAIHAAQATLIVYDNGNKLADVTDPEDRKILILGSGMVSKSVVDLLGRSKNRLITVASNDEDAARRVAQVARRGRHASFDVKNDLKQLIGFVKQSDLVISLLPAPMHQNVAQACIEHQTHMVTASYESEKIRDFDEAAKSRGVILLNEVGLDPGLDHMSAMKLIDDIHGRGGIVTGFRSVCGGLPSPASANNPLRYKFSWNPKGVISASQNSARYREEGMNFEIDGDRLLESAVPFRDAWPDLRLECLPNQDSLLYETVYGIGGATSIFRGTLRYEGFSDLFQVFKKMGLLGPQLFDSTSTWEDILQELRRIHSHSHALDDFVLQCSGGRPDLARRSLQCMEWLGLKGHHHAVDHSASVADLFCMNLELHLRYEKGETDMIVMHHSILASFHDGSQEHHTSSLQVVGDDCATAMCKTVGFPTAAAAELILQGCLADHAGLLLPTTRDIYLPILEKMEEEGIVFEDNVSVTMGSRTDAFEA